MRVCWFLAIVLFIGACSVPQPFTKSSMHFVETPGSAGAEGGMHLLTSADARITMNPEELDGGSEVLLLIPMLEGALSAAFAENYRFAMTAAPTLLGAEGLFLFVDDSVRIGLLHGVGVGAMYFSSDDEDGSDSGIFGFLNAGAGLFLQSYSESPFFTALRYTYGTQFSDADDFEATPIHRISLNSGLMLGDRPRVSPQLTVAYARWSQDIFIGEIDFSELEISLGVGVSSSF